VREIQSCPGHSGCRTLEEKRVTEFIHLPGIGNSGPSHWHSRWEQTDARARRFAPSNWTKPHLPDWIQALERAVDSAETAPVLVAHSLACLLVAHWHCLSAKSIRGAFLVSVPDPSSPVFPVQAASFANAPDKRLGFPSMIVASTDDPYGSLDYANKRAAQWGSTLRVIGAAGHINAQSNLGDWAEGRALLGEFVEGLS